METVKQKGIDPVVVSTNSMSLAAELHRTVGPITQTLGIGVAYCWDPEMAAIVKPGVTVTQPGVEWITEANKSYDGMVAFNLNRGDSFPGQVFVFYKQGRRYLADIVRRLVDNAIDYLEVLRREDSLLEELSGSWESLEAVYEISSELRSGETPESMLSRILERATASDNKMSAILWIADGATLVPLASQNCQPGASKTVGSGLVGRVVETKQATVINKAHLTSSAIELDEELSKATSIAVAPIATNQGSVGALETWTECEEILFDSKTIRLVQALALQAAMVVENDRLHKATIEAERVQQEIEIASRIQSTLLFADPPQSIKGLSRAASSLPSRQIGGDFYQFFEHGDSCVDVIVGDVMGKGMGAALVGAATKDELLLALSRLLSKSNLTVPKPEEIINEAHLRVTPQLIGIDSFTTLALARFDVERNALTLVDCGHTRTIQCRPDGSINFLQGDNVPLGFIANENYHQTTVQIEPGDCFLFYSDGVTEANNSNGEMYGEERLAQYFAEHAHHHPNRIVELIRDDVASFTNSIALSDDATLIVVKTLPPNCSAGKSHLRVSRDLSELAKVRDFVLCACRELKFTQDTCDSIVLAVNEAVTNVIKHGSLKPTDSISIEVETNPNALIINIRHQGRKFDRSSAAEPKFDGTREGGFGLFIIEQCFDTVSYDDLIPGERCIRLIKNLNPSPATKE